MTLKWRINKDDFELIGLESKAGDTLPALGESILALSVNFLSKKVEAKKIQTLQLKDGVVTKTKILSEECVVPKNFNLSTLSRFDDDEFKIQDLNCFSSENKK